MLLTMLCVFLPKAQAQTAGQVKYFPHAGYESRMVGGLFQGSNDNSTWTTLYTVTATPPDAYTTAALSTDPQTFRYLRYLAPNGSYGNVAEIEFDAGVGANAVKLTGTAFGTAGSYNNDGFTFQNALDGSTSTYFNAPAPGNGDYVGIDRGASVGQVRYYPRSGYPSRMVGGQFQGSTDNTNWTTLYTVTASPVPSQYTVAPIRTDPKTLRYLRYLAPAASYDDVAEIEFDSGITTPVKVTGTGFGTAGSYNNLGNVFSNALDGSTATYFDAPAPGNGDYVGIDQGAAGFSLSAASTSLSLPQGTAKTTIISLTNTGGFTGSVALTAPTLPTGVTAGFVPTSISGTATSTLTLTATTTATVGASTVTVTGTSGTLVKTTPVSLTVTANPILTSIAVSPATATVSTGGSQTFTAVANDQNGVALSPQPAITWTSTGVGMISTGGVYSAGSTAGTATVNATSGTVNGTASVTVNAAAGISLSLITAVNNQASLSWSSVSGATSYNIKRSTKNGSGYTTIGTSTTTSYLDQGLTDGSPYYYVVTSVIGTTESSPSNQVSATPVAQAFGFLNVGNGSVLSGQVTLYLSMASQAYGSDASPVNFYVDGVLFDSGGDQQESSGNSGANTYFNLATDSFANGPHTLTIKDLNGNVATINVTFNNVLFSLNIPSIFDVAGENGLPTTAAITASLTSAQPWKVSIISVDSAASTIQSFSGNSASINVSWNGNNSQGAEAPDDAYEVDISYGNGTQVGIKPDGTVPANPGIGKYITSKNRRGDCFVLLDQAVFPSGNGDGFGNMIAYLKAIKADLAPSQGNVWTKFSSIIHTTREPDWTADEIKQIDDHFRSPLAVFYVDSHGGIGSSSNGGGTFWKSGGHYWRSTTLSDDVDSGLATLTQSANYGVNNPPALVFIDSCDSAAIDENSPNEPDLQFASDFDIGDGSSGFIGWTGFCGVYGEKPAPRDDWAFWRLDLWSRFTNVALTYDSAYSDLQRDYNTHGHNWAGSSGYPDQVSVVNWPTGSSF